MAAEASWFDLLGAALVGGVTVKLLDIAYQEIRQRFERTRTARQFVDEHLDPLLKAADEVVGKLRALADDDFETLRRIKSRPVKLENSDLATLVYLFSTFWAQLDVIRREGMSISMNKDSRGKKLQSFIHCLESRRVRIVDRIGQRAIGEVMHDDGGKLLTYVAFVSVYDRDEGFRRWLFPLATVLARAGVHTRERQLLLHYGAVLHALLDSLDPSHTVTGDRPSYPEKLSKKTRADLKYRVFNTYLTFVRDPRKYLGPPFLRSAPAP